MVRAARPAVLHTAARRVRRVLPVGRVRSTYMYLHARPPTVWYSPNVATRYLAWATRCCGNTAYTAPLTAFVSGHVSSASRICRIVCTKRPVGGACTPKSAAWCYDALPVLYAFAREEALRVAPMWSATPRTLRYLRTGDESIRRGTWDDAWGAPRGTVVVNKAAEAAAWAACRTAYGSELAGWVVESVARAQGRSPALAMSQSTSRPNRRLARLLTAGHRVYGQRAVL